MSSHLLLTNPSDCKVTRYVCRLTRHHAYQWVLKPENSLVWHREVLAWINKYSGIEDEELARSVAELGV